MLIALLAMLLVAFTSTPSRAEVNIGDKPVLAFKAVDGSDINIEAFRGKIVLVDFWATWCAPCMGEAEHMVAVNAKYAPKGLQFLGISLDVDQQKMLKIAKEKGFTWPQYYDGLRFKNKIYATWGDLGIPFSVLLDPDGSVLWKGVPADIDDALEDAFKNHPPQLDPAILKAANVSCDKAEAAVKNGDLETAVHILASIPSAAQSNDAFAKRLAAIAKNLSEYADKALAAADAQIESKHYVQAATTLKEIAAAFGPFPAGEKARAKLAELMKLPEAKAQIEAAAKTDHPN